LCALQPRRNWWCWQRSWSARWSRHEVGGRTIAGGDHCGSGRGFCSGQMSFDEFLMYNIPLPRPFAAI
jgi:hypothetical protein